MRGHGWGSPFRVASGWYRVRRHVHLGCLQEEVVVGRQEACAQEGLDDIVEHVEEGRERHVLDGQDEQGIGGIGQRS